MQKRHCFFWECWYSTYYHGPFQVVAPGLRDVSDYITAPWKGRGWYRVEVNGSCYNCQVPRGSDFGPRHYLS